MPYCKVRFSQWELGQDIKGMVSLALDAWTSANGYAFLAVVMHYVNDDWELGRFDKY